MIVALFTETRRDRVLLCVCSIYYFPFQIPPSFSQSLTPSHAPAIPTISSHGLAPAPTLRLLEPSPQISIAPSSHAKWLQLPAPSKRSSRITPLGEPPSFALSLKVLPLSLSNFPFPPFKFHSSP